VRGAGPHPGLSLTLTAARSPGRRSTPPSTGPASPSCRRDRAASSGSWPPKRPVTGMSTSPAAATSHSAAHAA